MVAMRQLVADVSDYWGEQEVGKLKHYFVVSLRSLKKHWFSSMLSLLGLSFAFALSLISGMIVWTAFSSDSQWENADQIYVLDRNIRNSYYRLPDGFLGDVRSASPDIEAVTGLSIVGLEYKIGNKVSGHWAQALTTDFLSMFAIETLTGDMASVLNREGMVALSEDLALKLYGAEPAVGQILETSRNGVDRDYTVGAVYKLPENTTLIRSKMLFRYSETDTYLRRSEKIGFPLHQYFLTLKKGTDTDALAASFTKTLTEKYPDREAGKSVPLRLAPVRGAKLKELSHESMRLRYFGLFAATLLLLVIAFLNYISLSVAVTATRGKDIALRKILGAGKSELAAQYVLESLILVTLAYLASMALAALFAPHLSALTGQAFSFITGERSSIHLAGWDLAVFVLTGWGLALGVGLLAAIYPAMILVRSRTMHLLQSFQRGRSGGGVRLRFLLIVLQSMCGLGLTFGAGVIYFQISSLETADKGFDTDGLLYIRLWEANPLVRETAGSIVNSIRRINGVKNAALLRTATPLEMRIPEVKMEHPRTREVTSVPTMHIGDQFIETLGLPVVAGRIPATLPVWKEGDAKPTETIVFVNKRFLKAYELGTPEAALGTCLFRIVKDQREDLCQRITAVVGDHYQKLDENPVTPVIFVPGSGINFWSIMVRYAPEQEKVVFDVIQTTWDNHLPLYVMYYRYLDDVLAGDVGSQRAIAMLLLITAVGSLFLTMAGLYAMAKSIVLKRQREIAVRRVHGATGSDVVKLLVTQLLRPVVFGTLIGLPVGWSYAMQWLQAFSIRIEPEPWHAVMIGVFGVVFFILSASSEIVRAVRIHPAQVLHHE